MLLLLGEFHQRAKTRARSLRIDLRDDLSAMPVSSERSCGRAQRRMVPTLVDLVVVDAHRIRALPAPRESEQRLVESLDLLRDALAHTIRENPDISMERLQLAYLVKAVHRRLPRTGDRPLRTGPQCLARRNKGTDATSVQGSCTGPIE